ncbi:helix-turn-helix transcriptional regulator [Candidatus Lucifugimonas marina]|uniref:AAA family ATPase n=1 Tax=Candidatus Lucifugimonas marina TaxID=3038979 RepID=A0AAJ5ZFQ7_9CHLR|nr:AAA family ATPase [SAR202 cluster bacterium JH702]MDG0869851.1 AAA family ATPase [SAR202 cluster bacterium JH639]WFG34577.1 AAA family ATPase [SAR202 cluster bacterium JH545]WFG38505.1 AAA family ATPase [SAR202 cluster bacterium JH1073]
MTTRTGANQLVGRESELDELTAAFENAREGHGYLVTLIGEPGIGKTRLTQELLLTASKRQAITAVGTCYEGTTTPPYWAWIQLIRSLLTKPTDAILRALKPRAAVMAETVPEIKGLFPNTAVLSEVETGQARFRLFEAITKFLCEVAEYKPIVLVLDDLHWADQSTLDLIEYAVREFSSKPILVVGSYRDTELGRRHPLSDSLAKIARTTDFKRILLRGLDLDEVTRMVHTTVNESTSPELIAEIHERTEGNPFFVTEVVATLTKEAENRGGDFDALRFKIPEGVREAIGIRLNKLSDECNEILRTAAVIGREFDFSLLIMLNSERSEEDQLTLIEEAVAVGTVREVEGSRDHYEFAHALIQQTLIEELTTGRRVRAHARVVTAMEQLYAEHLSDHASDLLHHCTEGLVSEQKIVNYAQLAGDQATALYATREARAYYEQALQALGDDSDVIQRAEILANIGLGELLTLNYPHTQRGWDHVADAFKIYDEMEDHKSAVTLLRQARGFRPIWLHSREAVYSRALEMVEPSSTDAGYLLVQHAGALRFEEMDHDGAAAALDRALEIAIDSGNKRLETRVLLGLADNGGPDGDAEGAADLRRRAAVLAQETDQPIEEASARRAVLTQLISEVDAGDALRNIEEVLELERLFGFDTSIIFEQLRIAIIGGDLANIPYFADLVDRDHDDDSVHRILAGLALWHLEDTSELDERFAEAHDESQFAQTLWQRASNASFLSLVAWSTGRADDAMKAAVVAHSFLEMPKIISEIEAFARVAISISAIMTGNEVEAAEQRRHLVDGPISIAGTTYYFAGDRILAALANTAGLLDEATVHFEDALNFTSDPSYRVEAAWTCHDYAKLLIERASAQGRSAESAQHLNKARELISTGLAVAREIGTKPLENKFTTLQEQADSFGLTRNTRPDGLTNREVDVLRLICDGLSNQQIADELVITLSTTASHVANILGKTASSNRTEAAAYAIRQGLADA